MDVRVFLLKRIGKELRRLYESLVVGVTTRMERPNERRESKTGVFKCDEKFERPRKFLFKNSYDKSRLTRIALQPNEMDQTTMTSVFRIVHKKQQQQQFIKYKELTTRIKSKNEYQG